jgi:hypothetical protein
MFLVVFANCIRDHSELAISALDDSRESGRHNPVLTHLIVERFLCSRSLPIRMISRDRLFGAQCSEHAERDNAELHGKPTPVFEQSTRWRWAQRYFAFDFACFCLAGLALLVHRLLPPGMDSLPSVERIKV